MSKVYIVFDDRPTAEDGIRVAVSSLSRHDRDREILVLADFADAKFDAWLASIPNARRVSSPALMSQGWSVKPELLLWALDNGASEAIWIDSDIAAVRPLGSLFDGVSEDTIVCSNSRFAKLSEEGPDLRPNGWGFSTDRAFPFVINTCVVRVTPRHRELLMDWHELVKRPEYVTAQETQSYFQRPRWLAGDQDALTALLSSPKYSAVPVQIAPDSQDVFTQRESRPIHLVERIRCLPHRPFFVHAVGKKPWLLPKASGILEPAMRDLLPYNTVAYEYSSQLLNPEWAQPTTATGATLRRLRWNAYSRIGLPFSFVLDTIVLFDLVFRRIWARLRRVIAI